MSQSNTEQSESEFAIRISFLTVPGTTRAQAERAARSIQRHALQLARISHVYDLDVASEWDDTEMSEQERYSS